MIYYLDMNKQQGFGTTGIITVVVLLLVLGGGGYYVVTEKSSRCNYSTTMLSVQEKLQNRTIKFDRGMIYFHTPRPSVGCEPFTEEIDRYLYHDDQKLEYDSGTYSSLDPEASFFVERRYKTEARSASVLRDPGKEHLVLVDQDGNKYFASVFAFQTKGSVDDPKNKGIASVSSSVHFMSPVIIKTSCR